jgi:hypothetical protein
MLLAAGFVVACSPLPTQGTTSPGATTAPSSTTLRVAPANLGCDAIGVDFRRVTFHVDPTAAEPVVAAADSGRLLLTYWSAGFQLGTAAERVVRDPSGQVVVTDAEALPIPQANWPRLHGYFVCPAPDALYVLLVDPS